ncbi:MAG: MacB family efflux pump subunit [Burkholderiaceae bacterium]
MALIELREITRRHGETTVLDGVSLDIHEGEYVAIMGVSGSGKTTLMNLIGCLDAPSSGSYRFDGTEVAQLGPDALARMRRETFGFVFQHYHLLGAASAVENVEIPAIYAGVPRARRIERAKRMLASLGLAAQAGHRPAQMSGGQQQRVSIARALMNGGRVLLADEPTGALDSASGAEVLRLLRTLNLRGHTIVLVTHDPQVAAQATRLIRIADGRIVHDSGAPKAALPYGGLLRTVRSVDAQHHLPDLTEAARMAWRSLRSHVLRTTLTLLGIVIGVASVVAMLSLGEGGRQAVLERIDAMGTDLLIVRPGARGVRVAGEPVTLVPEDAEAIAQLPNVRHAVPEYSSGATLRAGAADYVANVSGTSEHLPAARNWALVQGSFFDESDMAGHAPVIVLGRTVARNLYGDDAPAIGGYLLVNNVPFQVIGVLAPKGATTSGADMDDVAFVPLATARARLFGKRYLRSIAVQVDDVARIDDTERDVTTLLTARHRRQDFQVRDLSELLEAAAKTQDTLRLLLGSVAAISLLVGGIGVMNIMLVSVTERMREIGIRMATGARRLHILLQFNVEALVVCAIGGLAGVAVGFAAAAAAQWVGHPVVYAATPALMALASAFATGVLFGYLPARKAARLHPVAALAMT